MAEPEDLLAQLEAAFEEEDDEEQPPPAKRQCGTAEPPAGPEERDSVEAGSGRQQATAAAAAPYQQESPLALLSEPLLLRVLAKLSPEDLLIVAQTCRHFRAAASDASLWRRLYYARWPDGPEQQADEEHVQGATWKNLYLEADERAVAAAQASAPSEAFRDIYLQMATARRSEALRDAEALFRTPADNASQRLATKVAAFRRQRNLLDSGQHARHCCRGGCTWQQLDGDAWICERSGFVHVCGAECAFQEPDASDLQVCAITGRCFEHMLTEREEHAGEWERGQSRSGRGEGEAEEDWGAEGAISSRLARAFVAGYECETDADFFRRFGVKIG